MRGRKYHSVFASIIAKSMHFVEKGALSLPKTQPTTRSGLFTGAISFICTAPLHLRFGAYSRRA